MNKYLYTICFFFLACFPFALTANAASVSFAGPKEIVINQDVSFDLVVNSETEELNAFEGKIVVPQGIEIKGVSDGSSIVGLWLKRPSVTGQEISFSGLTPGGFMGNGGKILSLTLSPKAVRVARLKISEITLLLNDGQGTKAQVGISDHDFSIVAAANSISAKKSDRDIFKPSEFVPQIAQDPSIFDNQFFLSFATTDKNSGINHYEVKEGGADFAPAASPYLLKDQSLKSRIVVRAFDNAGNMREAVASEGEEVLKDSGLINISVIIIIITTSAIALILYRQWRKK